MTTASAAGHRLSLIILTLTFFFFIPLISAAINLITPNQHLTTQETLVSATEVFELGFFNNSDNWYVGIWYKKVPTRTIIWVANRDSPVQTPSPNLAITAAGNLAIVDEIGKPLWVSNFTTTNPDTVAELLHNGNLIVRHSNDDQIQNYLWQSFDYPTDTLMPGMKLGWDSKSGMNRFITSWKSPIDPSSGDYSFKLELHGFPEVFLRNRGNMFYRSGPWNGIKFSGEPEMAPNHIVFYNFVMNPESQITYSYNLFNQSIYSRLTLNPYGVLQRLTWVPASNIWSLYWYAPKDQCDDFGECGPNGICDVNASPVCKCLKGFEPKNPQAWSLRDGSEGCILGGRFDCGTDGFVQVINVKLPAATAAMVDMGMGANECKEACRRNCSCRAFAVANITGNGSGCVFWAEDLYDMRQFTPSENAQDIHLRLPASLLEKKEVSIPKKKSKNRLRTWEIVVIAVSSAIFLLIITSLALLKKLRKKRASQASVLPQRGVRERSQEFLLGKIDNLGESKIANEELDLPLFDLNTLLMATNDFSGSNKLGRGGFGTVYKGKLEDGQEIAVKRLSKTSVQGSEEFTNEVKMIARLQHRNLVRLLGCCIEMEEKMLIYEYMENKSLDSVLFKKDRSSTLDWSLRFNIICGISRGLLYLHQDSRFRIIHRDLKPSNVLLDKNMNPKISDFGMARIFGGDQTEAETIRVVGTYGYMSPEYAMGGVFSVKSDVFSFGILVLEIVCGMKNRAFSQSNDHDLNLPAYAWKLHQEGRSVELLDPTIAHLNYTIKEVTRCIGVALLCVQEQPEDRPNMSNVVLMLSSDDVPIPKVKYPGYFLGRDPEVAENEEKSNTSNQITITMLQGSIQGA